jgi:hypothetical protein
MAKAANTLLFEQGVACVKWMRATWDEIGDDAGV